MYLCIQILDGHVLLLDAHDITTENSFINPLDIHIHLKNVVHEFTISSLNGGGQEVLVKNCTKYIS